MAPRKDGDFFSHKTNGDMDKEFLNLVSVLFEGILIGFILGGLIKEYSMQQEKNARRKMKIAKKMAKENSVKSPIDR